MKKPQVDTPYKNSWAHEMATKNYKIPKMDVPAIFINEDKLLETIHKE